MDIVYNRSVHLVWLNDKSQFQLTHSFIVWWGDKHFVVNAGMITDLASIPRIFRSLVPQMAHHLQPAVAHDWLYDHHSKFTRLQADQMFFDGMKAMGVSWWRRHAMYRAVRLAGSSYWKSNG